MKFLIKFNKFKRVYLSLPNNHFLVHISLLFLLFHFLPNTPHSSSIITAAATCFDELILDTEMYEQSLGIHSCVYSEIYPSLAPESNSPRRTREPESYVYGHLYALDRAATRTGRSQHYESKYNRAGHQRTTELNRLERRDK